jgi:two-component system NtrC family response regulator
MKQLEKGFTSAKHPSEGANRVKPKILLVEDDENVLEQMRWALDPDYQVFTATNGAEALATFEHEKPPVVTLDLSLNPQNPDDLGGLRLLKQMLFQEPSTQVIIVTANSDDTNALRAIGLGAFDYYSKPVRLDDIKVTIQRAFHIHRVKQRIRQSFPGSEAGFHGMIGKSATMQNVFRFIEVIAASDISVLIGGESGTGKELVAHAIHQESPRKSNPFVVVNCGAIPDTLLESELFGHEKGAFTGAYTQKRGKFELAHTGTLFFDEIGELAPNLQVKLLRFLQDRKIERVGGTQPIEADVRIIAATNRDLKRDMESNVFRKDLYYRLKVAPLDMPPLRERLEDIIPLANYFVNKYCAEHRKPPMTVSPEAEARLLMHRWPGNVRELENLISRAVMLSPHAIIKPNDLGFALDHIPTDVNLKFAKKALEMDFVKKALSRNKGIVSRAARELGISRVNLYELVDKYNISIHEFKIDRLTVKQEIKTREVS